MSVEETSKRPRGNIWWVTASPAIWSIHFLISYITAAIYCAKYATQDGHTTALNWTVLILTAIALGLITWIAVIGYRRHRSGNTSTPHDAPTREDQVRMIGWATFLLSLLSAVATIFTALVFVLVGSCH